MLSFLKKRLTDFLTHIISESLYKFHNEKVPFFVNNASYTQAFVVSLYNKYRLRVMDGKPLPDIHDCGFSIYSQFDEDGIIVRIFGAIGFTNRTFVDIGGGDGLFGNNTANLANNFGFHGLFIDYNLEANQIGEDYYNSKMATFLYPPKFIRAMVHRENINQLIMDNGVNGEIDFLSIDIDGNDYWVWDAIEAISPRVVVVETHIEFGMNPVVVPYDKNYFYPGKHPDYHGASPVAMEKLAVKKGYRLVATNRYGFNTFYVRADISPSLVPALPVKEVLRHPRNAERVKLFEPIKDFAYERV